MTKHLLMAVTALWLSSTAAQAANDELNVGDTAPKLKVKEFVKGVPVKDLEKGKIYVVEFWATWCPPCKTSIPHLTELQKQHKDVTFIGVSIWEQDYSKVKPFVEEMGAKMDYRVALDDVKGNGRAGAMAKTWMAAAGRNGIPAAFIVNGDGIVAWIGHPMGMEKPLQKIVDGKWDLEAAAKTYKKEMATARKMQKLQQELAKAQQSGDPKKILAVLDEVVATNPNLATAPRLMQIKFKALVKQADATDKALECGKHLLQKAFHNNADSLNDLAWTIVNPNAKFKPDPKLLKFALDAALRADEVAKHNKSGIADTLARAYFVNGDLDKAVETQERAVKLADGSKDNTSSLKKHLEQYKQAAKKE